MKFILLINRVQAPPCPGHRRGSYLQNTTKTVKSTGEFSPPPVLLINRRKKLTII